MGRASCTFLSLIAGVGLWLAAATADAQTAERPVVIELFTSQGCSSCPPADAYLGRLADRDDVVALSLHVDYWDYLGWRDVFGSPAHTARQRQYAAMMRERMIYTPQVVIQGREHIVGSQTVKLDEAIARQSQTPLAATIELTQNADRLIAEITPDDPSARSRGRVLMAWYNRAERVEIQRGENRGRSITYHNVVKGWSELGLWRGARIALTAPKPMGADGVAVLIQANDGGPILGAGRLELK